MEKIRINACTSNTHKYRELVAILGDEFEVVQHPIERELLLQDDYVARSGGTSG